MIPFSNILHPELWEYGDIARNLIGGHGYAIHWHAMGTAETVIPSAFMPPGVTLVHLFGIGVFGDNLSGYLAIFLIQALCGVGFVYFSARLVEELFSSRRIAMIAAWSAALYPSFVYATTTFGVATEALFLNALFLFLAFRLRRAIKEAVHIRHTAILLGVAAGVLSLFRSEAPLFIMGTLFLLLIESRATLRRAIWATLTVTLFALLVITPWTLRNFEEFHALVPGSTSGGLNLWKGNNPLATGSGWNAQGAVIGPTDTLVEKLLPTDATRDPIETRVSSQLAHEAVGWITAHPGETILLDLKKAIMLWVFDWYNPASKRLQYEILSVVTLLAATFGVLRYVRGRVAGVTDVTIYGVRLIGLIAILSTALVMLFFVAPRYSVFLVGNYWPFVVLGIDGVFPSAIKDNLKGRDPL